MSLLHGKFSYSKCQSSNPQTHQHWGGPCTLRDQKGAVTHVLKIMLRGYLFGTLGFHSCSPLPPEPLGTWLWGVVLSTYSSVLLWHPGCLAGHHRTGSGCCGSILAGMCPQSSSLLERAWGALQPFATALLALWWCRKSRCPVCHAPLPFILSSVPHKISGRGQRQVCLKQTLPSCRKHLSTCELSLWHRHALCLRHLKSGHEIKDLHATPVLTLFSMATDPFFVIFILCRCFSPSEIIALKPNKTPSLCVRVALHVHAQLCSFSQHTFGDSGVKSPAATVVTYKWSFDSLLLTVNWITLRD